MDGRRLARRIAAGRAGLGTALLALPELSMRSWVGQDAARPGTKLITRGFGARDLALGLGTLRAEGDALQLWVTVAMIGDATDLLATLGSWEDVPALAKVMIPPMAGGAVAAGIVTLLSLAREKAEGAGSAGQDARAGLASLQ